jgi:NADH-quinone oxidoreductase subunit F
MAEYKLLLEHSADPTWKTLDGYKKLGGYVGLPKALGMERSAIVDQIKASGLRGRGGAGAPAALKWGGMPKDKKSPHYLICNADEGEPGTFKDKQLLETCPFEMIEGMTIAGYAVQGDAGYIYIRGETKLMRTTFSGRTFLAVVLILISLFTWGRAPTSAEKRPR